MKIDAHVTGTDALTDELLGLLLDEAERALIIVEGRADEPGRRIAEADGVEASSGDVSELRLALAELVDAHPSIPYDLEMIGERMRNVGANAGTLELESHPEVLDLVRMSLEVFFRVNPSVELYEAEQRATHMDTEDDGMDAAADTYERYTQLLQLLRTRVS